MPTTPEQFRELLAAPEGARIEFKSAAGGYHFDKLVEYSVAIANEGGGKIILVVSREQALTEAIRSRLPGLIESGMVESQGRGRGTRYHLSRGLHAAIGKRGANVSIFPPSRPPAPPPHPTHRRGPQSLPRHHRRKISVHHSEMDPLQRTKGQTRVDPELAMTTEFPGNRAEFGIFMVDRSLSCDNNALGHEHETHQ